MEVEMRINGAVCKVRRDPDRSFLSVLRDELGLTGAKYGCGEAQCGACVVLLDGQPSPTCILPLSEVGAREVRTIEDLDRDGVLHPVQEAFLEADALQCGYCTPGMVLTVVALLEQNPDPSEAETSQALDEHLCRCGTYRRILKAVGLAARKMSGEEHAQ